MNAPYPIPSVSVPSPQTLEGEGGLHLTEYWDIVVDNRWLIAASIAVAVVIGAAYAFLTNPVYETNLLVQVEDSSGSGKSLLGEAAAVFEVKTPASAEIEIIRSRMILQQAVENTLLHIDAEPRHIPFVGGFLARRANSLSQPGVLGIGGYVSGTETIIVDRFSVPRGLEGQSFSLKALGNGRYELQHPSLERPLYGRVGATVEVQSSQGPISISVRRLDGNPGAEFSVIRHSTLSAVESLQRRLKLVEKGRQSGMIDVSIQGRDPLQLTNVLNEIGSQYVQQNIERKAAEAKKTLAFLEVQLPQFKQQLDQAEEAYNRFRNRQGTVSLNEESRLLLNQIVELQTKLLEAQQKRRDLMSRFTGEHPAVQTLGTQIEALNGAIFQLNSQVKSLPAIQQDVLRLERDVRINTDLYQQLRNNALQLQLVREGKIGNVRLIDPAVVPEIPISPRRTAIVGSALLIGLVAGLLLALARTTLFRGIRSPSEIEALTGLTVFSTIPLSAGQLAMQKRAEARTEGLHVLALTLPDDAAVESLRSLRTAMQFAMLDAPNNLLLITGPTPGVGKSFVSVNFAAVMAASGKRVLLVDADLRRGHLNQYFGVPRGKGLSELIAGTALPPEVIHQSLLPNLDLITTGTMPKNPAELVMRSTLGLLLNGLASQYDLILVDTAPVLAAADTLTVAMLAGTRLLVARAGETQVGELNESAKRMQQAGVPLTGVLFNAMDFSRRHYGGYGYRYGNYMYRQYNYHPSKPS